MIYLIKIMRELNQNKFNKKSNKSNKKSILKQSKKINEIKFITSKNNKDSI